MSVAVQNIVSAEWNDVPGWQDMVRAAFHHAAHIEVVRIEKGCDRDSKELLASNLFLQGLLKEMLFSRPKRTTSVDGAVKHGKTWRAGSRGGRFGLATTARAAAVVSGKVLLYQPLAFVASERQTIGKQIEVELGIYESSQRYQFPFVPKS